MDGVSLSWEVVAGLLGKTSVELQSALMIDGNDGKKVLVDQSNIDNYVADAVRTRLAEQKSTGKDENISFGKRTAFDEVEKYLAENHGIKKGTDWKAGISSVVTEAKTKAQTSDEVVKTSDAYKALVQELEQERQAHQTTKTDFRGYKVNQSFERELNSVLLDEALGLALPDDGKVRENQIKAFRTYLQGLAKLEPNDKGEILPADEKGKPLEDDNFIPLTLNRFIANNAKTFWPPKTTAPTRQAPPVGDPAGDGKGNGPDSTGDVAFPKWKDAQDFSDFIDKAILENKDSAFLEKATAAYESQPK